MRYAVIIIILAVVFTVMGLVAAWGTVSHVEFQDNQEELILMAFAFFPLGGAAVGLTVGAVAAIVGILSDRQQPDRQGGTSGARLQDERAAIADGGGSGGNLRRESSASCSSVAHVHVYGNPQGRTDQHAVRGC